MVLDTARPKYKENTTWLGIRGRDVVRKSIPKVNISQLFTIDFLEIQFIVNYNSQSDGQNKSAKSRTNLQKKTIHIILRMVSREKVFVNPPASSSSPYPGGFNPWISNVTEDTSPHVTSERQNPDTTLDPRCQSGPSARNSFDPKEGRSSKGLWGRPTKTADLGTSF